MRVLEPFLAQVIESVAERDMAIELGPRTLRDAQDSSGLAVDFTYETYGAALEVTTIQDDEIGGLSEIKKLAGRLSERFSGWLVVVTASARIKSLEPELISVLEAGQAIRPGDYGVADLNRWSAEGRLPHHLGLHRRLAELGVVDVVERRGLDRVEVAATGAFHIREGFSEALAIAVADNSTKLGACRPRETHLVVGVARFAASRDPVLSPVPSLPPEVDHLWVVHLWDSPGDDRRVWHAARGAKEWTLHAAPTYGSP